MRIVIALGGNALLRRSEPMTARVQRKNVGVAVRAIAPLLAEHSIAIVHGNGPQVGLLSLQAESYRGAEPYPLDILDAGTQGMIGYLIQQELRNLLPDGAQVVTVLTMAVVDPRDQAFADPAKFVGPVYSHETADLLRAKKGWTFKQDGSDWRRVVPSPEPKRIIEIQPITWLLDHGATVICAGGGGIPTACPPGYRKAGPRALTGVEAVIDKDLASELVAEQVGAGLFIMATDVDGVYVDWATPAERRLERVTPEELGQHEFPAGSMGPKVEAARRFVSTTGGRAVIGALADIPAILAGQAGTSVVARRAPQHGPPGGDHHDAHHDAGVRRLPPAPLSRRPRRHEPRNDRRSRAIRDIESSVSRDDRSVAMAESAACNDAWTWAIRPRSPSVPAISRSVYRSWPKSSARRWMSSQRALASSEPKAPRASAATIASCSAAPRAYASTSRARQPLLVAVWRRWARAIQAIKTTNTTAPSRIHSQASEDPDPLGAVPEGDGRAGDGKAGAAGAVVTGAGALVAVPRLDTKLLAAPLTAPA